MLEMGMRGFGQIDELARIAEPDVGVITNIGPVHLELVGSLEGVARAKAELLGGDAAAIAIIPPTCRSSSRSCAPALRRGAAGRDVFLEDFDPPRRGATRCLAPPRCRGADRARGAVPPGAPPGEPAGGGGRGAGRRRRARRACRRVVRGAARRARAAGVGAVVINDCYNANPLSMRAALDDLATQAPAGGASPCSGTCWSWARRGRPHRDDRGVRGAAGVDVLVAVGPRAARHARRVRRRVARVGRRAPRPPRSRPSSCAPGDVVLVKASRGIGLETVAEALAGRG